MLLQQSGSAERHPHSGGNAQFTVLDWLYVVEAA